MKEVVVRIREVREKAVTVEVDTINEMDAVKKAAGYVNYLYSTGDIRPGQENIITRASEIFAVSADDWGKNYGDIPWNPDGEEINKLLNAGMRIVQ